MELYVNPQITGFRQDVDGTIKELKIGSNKEDAYANIAGQTSADLENNKAATINVSTYTAPVEVKPSTGKDGMKKATITLSNIPTPSSGSITFYAWYNLSADVDFFTTTETPEVGDIAYSISGSSSSTNEIDRSASLVVKELTDNGIVLTYSSEDTTFTRESSNDIDFPKSST